MLPGTDREGALKGAENLREAIAGLTVTGVERAVTASFGVAVLPEDAPEAQALLRGRRPGAVRGEGQRARPRGGGGGLARVHGRRPRSTLSCPRVPS